MLNKNKNGKTIFRPVRSNIFRERVHGLDEVDDGNRAQSAQYQPEFGNTPLITASDKQVGAASSTKSPNECNEFYQKHLQPMPEIESCGIKNADSKFMRIGSVGSSIKRVPLRELDLEKEQAIIAPKGENNDSALGASLSDSIKGRELICDSADIISSAKKVVSEINDNPINIFRSEFTPNSKFRSQDDGLNEFIPAKNSTPHSLNSHYDDAADDKGCLIPPNFKLSNRQKTPSRFESGTADAWKRPNSLPSSFAKSIFNNRSVDRKPNALEEKIHYYSTSRFSPFESGKTIPSELETPAVGEIKKTSASLFTDTAKQGPSINPVAPVPRANYCEVKGRPLTNEVPPKQLPSIYNKELNHIPPSSKDSSKQVPSMQNKEAGVILAADQVSSRQEQASCNQQIKNGPFVVPIPPDALRKKSDLFYIKNKVYVAQSILGRGGTSKVYQVLDPGTDETYALKVVDLDGVDETVEEMFINEVKLLERLQTAASGHVVKLIDYEHNKSSKKLYILMEKGDDDLSGCIKKVIKDGTLDSTTIKSYWKQMLEAVRAIHKQKIVHSDLKPANFLVVSGNLKLIDFGIATAIQPDMTSVVRGSKSGTFNYMSPETIQDSTSYTDDEGHRRRGCKVGVKSDVWSLGCILYNLVYGRTPFQHITMPVAKLQKIADPRYDIQFKDCEDPYLLDTLKACLVRDPKKRPSTDDLLNHPYLTGKESDRFRFMSYLKDHCMGRTVDDDLIQEINKMLDSTR